jgi:hypothetical protein
MIGGISSDGCIILEDDLPLTEMMLEDPSPKGDFSELIVDQSFSRPLLPLAVPFIQFERSA